MTRVVDSSVALKWFVAEDGEFAARALIGESLLAPSLLLAEVSNAAFKKWRRKEMIDEQVRMVPAFVASFVELVPMESFAESAVSIALELDHPVYDCYYLAMCEQTGRPIVTADKRLINRCAATRFEALLTPL